MIKQAVEQLADSYSFAMKQVGMTPVAPPDSVATHNK